MTSNMVTVITVLCCWKIDELLRELGLEESAEKRAQELSGGQKRRLAIGMALVGSPRLLVLDEPTTGVDAVTRRHIWEVLRRQMRVRCDDLRCDARDAAAGQRILLFTTHYMDEADLLAGAAPHESRVGHLLDLRCLPFLPSCSVRVDRKAIMTAGRLRCCGSSLFLKAKFGIGYLLK